MKNAQNACLRLTNTSPLLPFTCLLRFAFRSQQACKKQGCMSIFASLDPLAVYDLDFCVGHLRADLAIFC